MKEAAPATPGSALDPNEWRSFKVVSKEPVTHNTSRLRCPSPLRACMQGVVWAFQSYQEHALAGRFATPNPDDTAGLFVASCLLTRAPIGSAKEDGTKKFVIRPYTPTSTVDAKGHFDLVRTAAPAQHVQHALSPCSHAPSMFLCQHVSSQHAQAFSDLPKVPCEGIAGLIGTLWDVTASRW